MKTIISLMILGSLLTACSLEKVAPWERNILAKPEMQAGSSSLENRYDDHIYFSKEASSGGGELGGGGCGCN